MVPSRVSAAPPDLRLLQKEPRGSPPSSGSPGMCVLSRLAALTLAQAARAVPRLCHLLTSAPPHPLPVPQASAGDALQVHLLMVCSARKPGCRGRQGRSPDAWLVGWLAAPATQVSVSTLCVWSPGSNPVRSCGDLQAGVLCVPLSRRCGRGCLAAGEGRSQGSQQHEKLFTARETESCDRGPCGVSRAGGPCPAPTDGASWNLLTGLLTARRRGRGRLETRFFLTDAGHAEAPGGTCAALCWPQGRACHPRGCAVPTSMG